MIPQYCNQCYGFLGLVFWIIALEREKEDHAQRKLGTITTVPSRKKVREGRCCLEIGKETEISSDKGKRQG